MSRRAHTAPMALASDGTALVNMAEFDGPQDLQSLLRRALQHHGAVFVGVQMSQQEVQLALSAAGDGYLDAAASIAGRRQRFR